MYAEHDEVTKRPWIETEKFIDVHQVKFTGFRCPRPLFKFEHANFPDYIMDVIRSQEKTYAKPTAMQCISWPVLLGGRDLIAVSKSNHGKHLSYMLPIIVHIRSKQEYLNKKGPYALILTPHQASKDDIYGITKPYLNAAEIKCFSIYEVVEKSEQIENLKANKDIHLLIANPVRLLELLEEDESILNLANVSFLVVDEYIQFRKLLGMDHVKKIVDRLRKDRQTAVFSRLVPSGIQRQGDEFVSNCIFFEMHHDKESTNDEIKQVIELVDKHLKISRLIELVDKLTRETDAKILIYAKDKEKCLSINFEIKRHLDLDVLDFRREENLFFTSPNCLMSTFKNIGLEIAIPDLNYIINADFPPNLQTYLDRQRKGVIHYTLFCREDAKHAERLIYSLKQARQEYDPHLVTMSKAWLECGRDMRFMQFMENIKKGISKPLQDIYLDSGDEDSLLGGLNSSRASDSDQSRNFSLDFGRLGRFDHHQHHHNQNNMYDDDDEEDDEDDDDDFDDDALLAQ